MKYLALLLFFFSFLARGDVTPASGTIDTYSNWNFNRTGIYLLRDLYLADDSANTMKLVAPDLSDDNTVFEFPADNGTADYYLNTDGTGSTSWNELDVGDDSDAVDTLGLGTSDAVEHESLDLSGTAGDGFLELKHQSSEPTSPSGTDDLKVFVDTKKVYTKDSTGLVKEVGSGAGAGEVNYILNPDESTNWSASGTGITVATTTTTSELPREPLTTTAIKITPVSGTTDYASYCFQIGDSDKNKALKIQAAKLVESGYATGDLVVEMYSNVSADCAGAYTQENIMGYDDDIADINASNDVMFFTWLSTDADWYELRFRRTAGTNYISLSNVVVGPGQVVKAPDPRWASYTEDDVTITVDNGTMSSYTCNMTPRQDSEGNWLLDVIAELTLTSDGSFDVNISGATISTNQDRYELSVSGLENATATAIWRASNKIEVRGTAATLWHLMGTVELTSKPTFADKAAPDVFLAGLPDQAALDGNWRDYTPTGTMTTNVTYTGKWRRVGENMEIQALVTWSGATDTASVTLDIPSGYTIDTDKLVDALAGQGYLGGGRYRNGGEYPLYVQYYDTNTVTIYYHTQWGTSTNDPIRSTAMTNLLPDTIASGDNLSVKFSVPITGWTWFDYIYQYIVGFNTATSDSPGLVKKNKYEVKYLSSDITSAGTLTDLSMSGLVVGEVYRATIQGHFQIGTDDDVSILITHDGSSRGQVRIRDTDTSSTQSLCASSSIVFTATTTTLTFTAASASANGTILGNGTGTETMATLELLNNYEVTTDF